MSITEISAKVREQKIAQKLSSASVEIEYADYCIDVTIRLAHMGDYQSGMDAVFNAQVHLSNLLDRGGASEYPYADDSIEYTPSSQLWYASIYRRFTDIHNI